MRHLLPGIAVLAAVSAAQPGFAEHLVKQYYARPWRVYAIDLDRDQDTDILASGYTADEITWWENDGSHGFTEHLITGALTGACGFDVADPDRDGDKDILVAADFGNRIVWFEQTAAGVFEPGATGLLASTGPTVFTTDQVRAGAGGFDACGGAARPGTGIRFYRRPDGTLARTVIMRRD